LPDDNRSRGCDPRDGGDSMKRMKRAITVVLVVAVAVLPCGVAGAQSTPGARAAVLAEIRQSLEDNLLAAWYPFAADVGADGTYGGYLSDFDADWQAVGDQKKFIVTQARHVWTAARAAAAVPDR